MAVSPIWAIKARIFIGSSGGKRDAIRRVLSMLVSHVGRYSTERACQGQAITAGAASAHALGGEIFLDLILKIAAGRGRVHQAPVYLLGYARVPVSYTHLRAHETPEHLVCRLLLEKTTHT